MDSNKKRCHAPRCQQHQERKAESLISCLIHHLISNVFSVQQKRKNWPCCSTTFGEDEVNSDLFKSQMLSRLFKTCVDSTRLNNHQYATSLRQKCVILLERSSNHNLLKPMGTEKPTVLSHSYTKTISTSPVGTEPCTLLSARHPLAHSSNH